MNKDEYTLMCLAEWLRAVDKDQSKAFDYAAKLDDIRSRLAANGADSARDAARYRFLRGKMGFTEVTGKPATMSLCGSIPAPGHNFHTDWVGDRFDASVDEAIDAAIAASAEKTSGG